MKAAKLLPECKSREDFNKPFPVCRYEVVDGAENKLFFSFFKLCDLQKKCLEKGISPLDVKVYRVFTLGADQSRAIADELKIWEFAFSSTVVDNIGPFYIIREAWSWSREDCDDSINSEDDIKHLSIFDRVTDFLKLLFSNK
jgi:hypothetical protein